MEGLRNYIISIGATALICAVTNTVLKGSVTEKLFKQICGLVMLLCVLRPISHRTWSLEDALSDIPLVQWEDIQNQENKTYHNALSQIIKQKTQSYILDKASDMGLSVTVEVTVSDEDPPVPQYVKIRGYVSPYEKLCLEELIQEDLNISKENQFWTG